MLEIYRVFWIQMCLYTIALNFIFLRVLKINFKIFKGQSGQSEVLFWPKRTLQSKHPSNPLIISGRISNHKFVEMDFEILNHLGACFSSYSKWYMLLWKKVSLQNWKMWSNLFLLRHPFYRSLSHIINISTFPLEEKNTWISSEQTFVSTSAI